MRVDPARGADPAARIDPAALRRTTQRLLRSGQVPWLHAEAARRMGERLPLVRLRPATVIDWSGPLGASGELLSAAYPRAQRHAIRLPGDPGPAPAARWWTIGRRDKPVAPEAIEPAAAQLVWANMMLHGASRPRELFEQWHRTLAVGGFLMFSTLGPGSLVELRDLYRELGWGPPMADLLDMHDLGDELVAAGFADPVMDQEVLKLSWSDAAALFRELRGWGGNVSPGRHAGCRTPRWRNRLFAAVHERAGGARPSLSVELVYGHAFRSAKGPRVDAQTSVSLDEMRALMRAGRVPPG